MSAFLFNAAAAEDFGQFEYVLYGQSCKVFLDTCPNCGSAELDGISRITNYMSKVENWNKGKLGELHDRFRTPPQA